MDIRKLGTTLYHLVQTVQDPTPPYQRWCLLKDINGNQLPYVQAEKLSAATRDEERDFQQQLASKAGVERSRLGEAVVERPRLGEAVVERPRLGEAVVERPRLGEAVVERTSRLGQPAAVERPFRFEQAAPLERSSRFGEATALVRPSRFGQAVERPTGRETASRTPLPPARVYPPKACTLPQRIFHKFELMNLSARYHGGIAGMIPGVRWEFIGFCVETDSESLDLFQFDATGKSAFQDNFFNHYNTLVSYCVERGTHYACFTPMSESIVRFVAWYLAQEQVVTAKLKQYMSYAAIEEYRRFVEVKEREKRMYILEAQRAEQARRGVAELARRGVAEQVRVAEPRAERLRESERAAIARVEQRRDTEEAERLKIIAEQTRAEQERALQVEFDRITGEARRRTAETHERFAAESRAMDEEARRRDQQEINAALLYEAQAQSRAVPGRRYEVVPEMAAAREVPLYGSPVRRQVEPVQDFPSMETINAAKRALGYPEVLTSEQECLLIHYVKTGQRPEVAVNPVCNLLKKRSLR